jgi:glutamyl-tRNA synthetase
MEGPRLRFAPSPTGMFHVGGARTALFNWFYVQQNGGTFVLRIEDTDQERNKPEWIQGIQDALTWLGVSWDEGPNFQSANKTLHTQAGSKLLEAGMAYYCDCTRESVEARAIEGQKPGYDNFCRDRGLTEGALRFRVPEGTTVVHDLIRGDVEFDNANIEDFVVVRTSGDPMFIVANTVDDMHERITHVVRGEEHLPNTPKQILLWRALSDTEPPTYAHLAVIVNEKRQKLSKRRDKVALEMYRDEGYLQEAMRNYLALLGWAPKGDREIVDVQVMIDEFAFEDVQKSPAFFDVKKLTAFNGDYIRALSVDEFVDRSLPFIESCDGDLWPAGAFAVDVFRELAPLVQERVSLLTEIGPMIDFLFVDEVVYEEAAMKVMEKPESMVMIDELISRYAAAEWKTGVLHDIMLEVAEANQLKLGKAQAPIRLAVTGKKVGPPLFESLELLGREKVIERLTRLRDTVRG